MFRSIQIQLACQPCIDNGKVAECTHMLHLVPRWQSSERHIRLKTIMQDRPDLIESELSGLAFDSLQNCFREKDVSIMFDQTPLPPVFGEPIFIVVDPAAGGPQSDYAFISFTRNKGLVQVIPMSSLSLKRGCRRYGPSPQDLGHCIFHCAAIGGPLRWPIQ